MSSAQQLIEYSYIAPKLLSRTVRSSFQAFRYISPPRLRRFPQRGCEQWSIVFIWSRETVYRLICVLTKSLIEWANLRHDIMFIIQQECVHHRHFLDLSHGRTVRPNFEAPRYVNTAMGVTINNPLAKRACKKKFTSPALGWSGGRSELLEASYNLLTDWLGTAANASPALTSLPMFWAY